MTDANDVTALLVAWSNGETAAGMPLMDAVYGELRQLARRYLRHERPDHSLPATALVHEAYVKLVDQRRVRWQNRAHFYAVAAQVMRRLLVDHARAHHAEKRGAAVTISLDGVGRRGEAVPFEGADGNCCENFVEDCRAGKSEALILLILKIL